MCTVVYISCWSLVPYLIKIVLAPCTLQDLIFNKYFNSSCKKRLYFNKIIWTNTIPALQNLFILIKYKLTHVVVYISCRSLVHYVIKIV